MSLGSVCNFPLFQRFNIKVATAHHPVIQKKVKEPLIKGVIEPFTGSTGFYSNASMANKHTGGFQSLLSLKHLNCPIHILTF